MKTTYTIWNLVVVVVCGFSVVNCKPQKPRPDEIVRVINETHSIIWRCSVLECAFGQGSSVPCGTSVPFNVHIECVECVEGESYSDSHGYAHCKTCRQCAEHEETSGKCTKEKDTTKCLKTCHKRFYWDDLTDSCRPCSDCCKYQAFQLQKHCENLAGHQCRNYTDVMCEHPTNASQDKEPANQNGNPQKDSLSMLEIAAIVVSTLLLIVVVVPIIILLVMWKLCGWDEAKTHLMDCFCFCCHTANSNDENARHFNNEVFDEDDVEPITWRESDIHLEEATDTIGSLKSELVNKEMHSSIPPVAKRPGFLRLCSVPVKTHPIAKSEIPRSHSHPGALKDLNKELPENKPATSKKYVSDWKTKKFSKKGYIPVPTNSDLPDSIHVVVQGPAGAEREEKPKKLRPPTLASKDQSTSITGLHHPTNILAEVPQAFQNRLLSRKMADIPIKFYRKICIKLDTLRACFWDDFRMLGEAIGLEKDDVSFLGQIGSPTDKMMKKFDSQRGSSIGKFKNIVEGMDRDDVVSVINEWIFHEFKSCPDMFV